MLILLIIVMYFAVFIYEAYSLTLLWSWFVVPFGITDITIAKPRPTNRSFVLSNLHQPSLTSIFHLHRPTWTFGTPPHSLDYGY